MDEANIFHKIEAFMNSLKAHYFLVKLTQLLVLVSMFSFLITPSSLLAIISHINFYFSTFAFQLCTHTLDKNFMFLLCNGLLVFVGITKSLSWSIDVDEPSKYVGDGSQSQYSHVVANKPMLVEREDEEKSSEIDEHIIEAIEIKYSCEEVEEKNIIEEIILEDEEETRSDQIVLREEEGPDEEIGLFDEKEEDEDKDLEFDEFFIEENEEGEVVEEEIWVLSTEELNKKFDDFIKRMKEDLRIEARRQLVMV